LPAGGKKDYSHFRGYFRHLILSGDGSGNCCQRIIANHTNIREFMRFIGKQFARHVYPSRAPTQMRYQPKC